MTSINNTNQFDTNFFDETYAIFYIETEALLAEIELLLLNVDVINPNMDDLKTIAHIMRLIKEIAVMFYSIDLTKIEMSETLNESENWLDKVCKNEMAITTEHINHLLAAKDLLKIQLMRHSKLKPVIENQNAGGIEMHDATRTMNINGALNGC